MVKSPARANVSPTKVIAHLRELVAALDRRIPQVTRLGEQEIAFEAAGLKRVALERIEALLGVDSTASGVDLADADAVPADDGVPARSVSE